MICRASSPLLVPARGLSPRLSESNVSVRVPSPSSGTGHRVNRYEWARQAQQSLDVYRAEPAAAPSVVLSTSSQAVRGTAFPACVNTNTGSGPRFQSHHLHQQYGALTDQQPMSAQISTYSGAPGSQLLSRNWEPASDTTSAGALSQRRNISTGDLKQLGSPQRRAERAQVILDKAGPAFVPTSESPVPPPRSPVLSRASPSGSTPRMRAFPGAQSQSAHTSPRAAPRSPLGNIKEEGSVDRIQPTTRPLSSPSPRLVVSSQLGTGPLSRPRAASVSLATEITKQQERLQRRKGHLRHGTWQQGRFRPPWDILTEVGSVVASEMNVETGPDEEVNLPPSLNPWSPDQHVHVFHPTSTMDSGNLLDDQVDDPEQLESMSDVLSLLPPGLPTTLRTYLLLTILAEHYFDTLQQPLAIHIYLTYLAPPSPPAGTRGSLGVVAQPPKAATFFTLGQMYLSAHLPLSALAAFEQAIAHDPYDVASQVQVGFVNFLLDRYIPAWDAYRQALLSMREAETVNYRVLGLDAVVSRTDVIQSITACEREEVTARGGSGGGGVGITSGSGGGGGVWGIGTGKIYRVPECRKRNIGRRKYFEQSTVVGRVMEVGRVGPGGTRETVLTSAQNFVPMHLQHEDQSSIANTDLRLDRVLTGISTMSAWSSPLGSPVGERWRARDARGQGSLDRPHEYAHCQDSTGCSEPKEKRSRYSWAKAETDRAKGKKEKNYRRRVSLDSLLDGIRRL